MIGIQQMLVKIVSIIYMGVFIDFWQNTAVHGAFPKKPDSSKL